MDVNVLNFEDFAISKRLCNKQDISCLKQVIFAASIRAQGETDGTLKMVYLKRIKKRTVIESQEGQEPKKDQGSTGECSHSYWSSTPMVGKLKEGTRFSEDLLRDGARSGSAGPDRNGGRSRKQTILEPQQGLRNVNEGYII